MLCNWYIPELAQKCILNGENKAIISSAVFMSRANKLRVNQITLKCGDFLRRKGTAIFGCDELNDSYFDKILGKLRLDKNESKLFSDEIYNEFKRMLQPVEQVIDQQYQITFSKDLQHLITSRRNYKGKIRVAGCGKTTVMAQRAVSAFKQTGKRVLILTYNITLCNYIYDRISDVWPREYGGCKNMRANIIVIHYHLS